MNKLIERIKYNPIVMRVFSSGLVVPVALLILLLLLGVASAAEQNENPEQAGYGTFSEGYRIGQLSKYSVKGWVWKSGEGEMLVGNESTYLEQQYSCGDKTCTRIVNPWPFSSGTAYADFIRNYVGDYAVIRYRQARVKSLERDTEYEVMEVMAPLDPTALGVDSCVASEYVKGSKSAGVRVGRLVKLSWKGTFSKTYEVTMQVGNSGNQFHYMSISDGEDKDEYVGCLLQMLMSGAKVKVRYSESLLYNPLTRDTGYDIVSVKKASSGLGE